MATTYTDCITFTGESSDFTLKASYKEWDGTVEYSTDHNTWTVWNGTEISSSGQKLYLRGSGNTKFYTSNGAAFVLSARAACSGNIQTLLEYSNPPTNIPSASCYRSMFDYCKNLTKAPTLPATTLANNCYQYMFYGCESLTQAPALPATTLASFCYGHMFSGCTSLITAPKLPATTLAVHCYNSMFRNCTSLTTAPELPATTLGVGCYNGMFNGCTSLKISSIQSTEYPTAWRIPSSGTISSTPAAWNNGMLSGTGGTFSGNPSINTTYYGAWSSVEIYPKINSFTYHGKQINNINGKHIRYVHDKRAGMDNTYEMVYVVQLATPQNVTAVGTTVSWDEVENATSYEIYADGVSIGTVENESGETWLINDNAFAQSVYNNKTYTALFNSNGQTFNSIIINNNPKNGGMFYDSTKVVDPDNASTFIDQAYRTVTFETAPTGELLTWLQANATKQ